MRSRLQVERLSFARERRRLVLSEVTFELAAGEVLCVLGPNGAGKSTLLRCVIGAERGWSGDIRVDGRDRRRLSRLESARLISYVPQASRTAFSFTVAQFVMLGRMPHMPLGADPTTQDWTATDHATDRAGILELRDRRVDSLSGGEQQLALLARALAQDTPVVLLDEPTGSLDLGNQAQVLRIIQGLAAEGRSVLMTTHLPEQAFLLRTRALLLKQGAVAASGPASAVCTEAALSDLYGAPVRLLLHDGIAGPVAACLPEL